MINAAISLPVTRDFAGARKRLGRGSLNRSQEGCRLAQWGRRALFAALLLLPLYANAAITITTNLPGYYSLNSVIQGVAFQATGAQTPIVWSISAGSLPPGLNLP